MPFKAYVIKNLEFKITKVEGIIFAYIIKFYCYFLFQILLSHPFIICLYIYMCVRVCALHLTQNVRYPIHHFSYALICYPNDERYVNLTANTSYSTTYLYVSMCEQVFAVS